MIFAPTPLAGAFVITPEPVPDSRGFFARLFCARAFTDRGLNPHLEQISMSYNEHGGTVRGLHLQRPPFAEEKLVRVAAGAVFDVIVDLRAGSPSYGQWFGLELSAANRHQLYIPKGFGHGFQTLVPGSEVVYHISAGYQPGHAAGVRWNDPDLKIGWPRADAITISERDAGLPMLKDFEPVQV